MPANSKVDRKVASKLPIVLNIEFMFVVNVVACASGSQRLSISLSVVDEISVEDRKASEAESESIVKGASCCCTAGTKVGWPQGCVQLKRVPAQTDGGKVEIVY